MRIEQAKKEKETVLGDIVVSEAFEFVGLTSIHMRIPKSNNLVLHTSPRKVPHVELRTGKIFWSDANDRVCAVNAKVVVEEEV